MAFLQLSVLLACTLALGNAVSDTCAKSGPICASDNAVGFCVQTPEGFQKIEVEQCNQGFHCGYTTKRCVADEFTCNQEGVFPDPYDCHKYYVCNEKLEAKVDYCIRYYHFDALTGKCELHGSPGECEKGPQAVPECKELLQTGALESNTNYYYVCARAETGDLYPKLYKCGEKQYYDAVQKACVRE